jgi:hypothetical protein
MLDWLADPDILVLRRSPVLNNELLYSLGHDAIGLALYEWKIREEEANRQRELREKQAESERKLRDVERIKVETRIRTLWVASIATIAIAAAASATTIGSQYFWGKAKGLSVLMSAAERLVPTDYEMSAWAGFSALSQSDAITIQFQMFTSYLASSPTFLDPKQVFSDVTAAGPRTVIKPTIPMHDNSNVLLLPYANGVVFFDGEHTVEIV